jgi:MFS family permease
VVRGVAAIYVCVGVFLAVVGPISDRLRTEFHTSRTLIGVHGSFFGWALIVIALFSRTLGRRLSPIRLHTVAPLATCGGLAVMTIGHHLALTLVGAAVAGAGAASYVLAAPTIIATRFDGVERTAAFTLVNAIGGLGSVVVTVVLGQCLNAGWGWRAPIAVVASVLAITVLATAAPVRALTANIDPVDTRHVLAALRTVPGAARRWLVLMLGIATEFAIQFWASTTLRELAKASSGTGTLGVALFAFGMAGARLALAPRLTALDRARVLRVAFGVLLIAFVPYRFGPGVQGRMIGL